MKDYFKNYCNFNITIRKVQDEMNSASDYKSVSGLTETYRIHNWSAVEALSVASGLHCFEKYYCKLYCISLPAGASL